MCLELIVGESGKPAAAIACVRRVIHDESIAVVRERIQRGKPVMKIPFASTSWHEESQRFLALIGELDRCAVPYRLYENGFEVSRTYVENVVAESARELELEERLMQLESGVLDDPE